MKILYNVAVILCKILLFLSHISNSNPGQSNGMFDNPKDVLMHDVLYFLQTSRNAVVTRRTGVAVMLSALRRNQATAASAKKATRAMVSSVLVRF